MFNLLTDLEDYCKDDVLKTYYLFHVKRSRSLLKPSWFKSAITSAELGEIHTTFDNQVKEWAERYVIGPVSLEEWAEQQFDSGVFGTGKYLLFPEEASEFYVYKRWDIDQYLKDIGWSANFIDATTGQHINRHEARLAGGNAYIVSK